MLGVDIRHYFLLDLKGFVDIVDLLGGVEIEIQENMYYNDPGNVKIDLKKGKQILYGKEAMQFIRFRKGYALADITRIDAQKQFLSALISKVMNTNDIKTIGSIAEKIMSNIMISSISAKDFVSFSIDALSVDLDSIYMITLPGEGNYYAYEDFVLQIINTHFNIYTDEQTKLNIFTDGVTYKYKPNEFDPMGRSARSILDDPFRLNIMDSYKK